MSARSTRRPGHPTLTRVALAAGFVFLIAFVYVVLAHGANGGNIVGIVIAVVLLIAAGNLLYGRHSHGAAAQARVRDAQEAQNRAADLAADARRATAEADRRGERFCPMDPDLDAQRDRVHTPAPHAPTPPTP